MSQKLILHHFPQSTFAEKIRKVMGLKNLNWRSVLVNRILPRPHLQQLTGGYRRIPVLQVGADMYCDTYLIVRTLDRLQPKSPTLLSNSLAQPMCWWLDKTMFVPILKLRIGLVGDSLSKEWYEDRQKFAPDINFSKESNRKDIPLNAQQINAHLAWLINILNDGRQFLLGDPTPSVFDATAYHIIWFIKSTIGNETKEILPKMNNSKLIEWFNRIAAFGHGTSEEMSSEEAFKIAKHAEPLEPTYLEKKSNFGYYPGQRVQVTPDDMGKISVEGAFVAADDYEIVVRLSNEKMGNINVHFPRVGFDLIPLE